MAVVWQASGTLLGSTGADITPVIPSHAADDILILHAWARSSSVTLTTPSGWTLIEGPIDNGSTMRNYWFWKRATNGSTTNPLCDWSATTGDKYGVVHVFRGVRTSGNPWDHEVTATGTVDPGTAAGVTASHLNTLVVSVGMSADNAASTVVVTATSPASLTTHSYTTVNTGGDAGRWAASGAKATAGASGNIGLDFDAAPLQWGNLSMALVPPPTTHSATATLAGTGTVSAAGMSVGKIKTDLVAYYRLESDGTDSTGRGNTLTDNNTVTFQAEKVGNGAKFTRVNNESLSRAHGGDLTFNGTDFTIQVWVKITSGIGTNWQQFVSKRADPNNRAFSLWMTPDAGGVIQFLLSSDGTNNDTLLNEYPQNQPPTSGTWYHILAWVTGGNAYIQVNGGSVYSQTCAGVYNSTATFYLGDDGPGGAEFDGEMDEVAIWKRALDADERAWLYNGGTGRTYSEVAPSTTHSAAATLAGTGTIAARGGRTRPGTGTLAGAGTVAARGGKQQAGTAALAGAGTFASTGTRKRTGTIALAGAGTLLSTGTISRGGKTALAGTGTIAARANRTTTGTANLLADGSTFTAGLVTRYGRADLTGAGTLAAAGQNAKMGTAALDAAGTLGCSANVEHNAASAIAGAGTLTAAASVEHRAASAIAGAGTLAAAPMLTVGARSLVMGAGTLAAAGTRTTSGTVALIGTGALIGSGTVIGNVHDIQGTATLASTATVGAAGAFLVTASSTLTGTAMLDAAGALIVNGAGSVVIGARAPVVDPTAAATCVRMASSGRAARLTATARRVNMTAKRIE